MNFGTNFICIFMHKSMQRLVHLFNVEDLTNFGAGAEVLVDVEAVEVVAIFSVNCAFELDRVLLCAIIGLTNLMCLFCLHHCGYSKQGSWSLPHSSVNFSKSYRPQQPPSSYSLVISRLLNRFHSPGDNNHLKCCLRILLITLSNQLSNGVKMHKPCWLILQLLLITLPGTLIQVHLTM